MTESDELVARAKAIVDSNAYMTLATADAAGKPWVSPVWFAHDAPAVFLWVSRPGTRHSSNVAARPEVAAVIFDSTVPENEGDGVYIDGDAGEADGADIDAFVAVFSERSVRRGGAPWSRAAVTGDAQHRLYVLRPRELFVLDEHDHRVRVEWPSPSY